MPHDAWDLSSATRDWTPVPLALEAWSINHWTAMEIHPFDFWLHCLHNTKLRVRKINTFLPLVRLKDLWISKFGSEAPGFPGVWNVSNWFKLAWHSFQVWKWWPLPGHLPSSFSCLDLLSYSPDGTSCFSPSPSVKRAHLVCRRCQKNACLGLISINIFFANKFV